MSHQNPVCPQLFYLFQIPNLRGSKCWFWNKVPDIERAISRSNNDQFPKLKTFLKLKFCGVLKNSQNIYPRCFGGREITKNKVSKVLVDTLYIKKKKSENWKIHKHSFVEYWFLDLHTAKCRAWLSGERSIRWWDTGGKFWVFTYLVWIFILGKGKSFI